jgi:hypothetical protein
MFYRPDGPKRTARWIAFKIKVLLMESRTRSVASKLTLVAQRVPFRRCVNSKRERFQAPALERWGLLNSAPGEIYANGLLESLFDSRIVSEGGFVNTPEQRARHLRQFLFLRQSRNKSEGKFPRITV